MTALKRDRKAQSHTATGKALAMTAAATTNHSAWPRALVDLPRKARERRRALGWFDCLVKHRTPQGWQPADPARIALLAKLLTAWERECSLLMEGEGGDAGLADKWRSAIGQLSRQLGVTRTIRAPHLLANDAVVRAEIDQHLADIAGDDLLAQPMVN